MDNRRIQLLISPKDIYNKLSEDDKNKYKSIEIKNATLCHNGDVIIECLLLKDGINKEVKYCQNLLDEGALHVE